MNTVRAESALASDWIVLPSGPEEAIYRARRLGTFVTNGCPRIVAKFISLKIKNSILSKIFKLEGTRITSQEYHCKATRLSLKKLLNFGKASGKKFNFRYNKLFFSNKCYAYYAPTDSMYEFELPNARSDIVGENSGQGSASDAERLLTMISSPPS